MAPVSTWRLYLLPSDWRNPHRICWNNQRCKVQSWLYQVSCWRYVKTHEWHILLYLVISSLNTSHFNTSSCSLPIFFNNTPYRLFFIYLQPITCFIRQNCDSSTVIHPNLYCRMQHAQQSSFYNHGGNFKVAKKRKGNAYHHLEKFTAVQQLALFAPEIEITLERNAPNSPYFKARAQYKGVTIEALQQGKKKAKQALCSKIIRVSTYHLVVNIFYCNVVIY